MCGTSSPSTNGISPNSSNSFDGLNALLIAAQRGSTSRQQSYHSHSHSHHHHLNPSMPPPPPRRPSNDPQKNLHHQNQVQSFPFNQSSCSTCPASPPITTTSCCPSPTTSSSTSDCCPTPTLNEPSNSSCLIPNCPTSILTSSCPGIHSCTKECASAPCKAATTSSNALTHSSSPPKHPDQLPQCCNPAPLDLSTPWDFCCDLATPNHSNVQSAIDSFCSDPHCKPISSGDKNGKRKGVEDGKVGGNKVEENCATCAGTTSIDGKVFESFQEMLDCCCCAAEDANLDPCCPPGQTMTQLASEGGSASSLSIPRQDSHKECLPPERGGGGGGGATMNGIDSSGNVEEGWYEFFCNSNHHRHDESCHQPPQQQPVSSTSQHQNQPSSERSHHPPEGVNYQAHSHFHQQPQLQSQPPKQRLDLHQQQQQSQGPRVNGRSRHNSNSQSSHSSPQPNQSGNGSGSVSSHPTPGLFSSDSNRSRSTSASYSNHGSPATSVVDNISRALWEASQGGEEGATLTGASPSSGGVASYSSAFGAFSNSSPHPPSSASTPEGRDFNKPSFGLKSFEASSQSQESNQASSNLEDVIRSYCQSQVPHQHDAMGGCLPPSFTLCDPMHCGVSAPHSHLLSQPFSLSSKVSKDCATHREIDSHPAPKGGKEAAGFKCQWGGCCHVASSPEELGSHVTSAHIAVMAKTASSGGDSQGAGSRSGVAEPQSPGSHPSSPAHSVNLNSNGSQMDQLNQWNQSQPQVSSSLSNQVQLQNQVALAFEQCMWDQCQVPMEDQNQNLSHSQVQTNSFNPSGFTESNQPWNQNPYDSSGMSGVSVPSTVGHGSHQQDGDKVPSFLQHLISDHLGRSASEVLPALGFNGGNLQEFLDQLNASGSGDSKDIGMESALNSSSQSGPSRKRKRTGKPAGGESSQATSSHQDTPSIRSSGSRTRSATINKASRSGLLQCSSQTHSHGKRARAVGEEEDGNESDSDLSSLSRPSISPKGSNEFSSSKETGATSASSSNAINKTEVLVNPTHTCDWVGCGISFPNHDTLTAHVVSEHIGSGKSEYHCGWRGCERAEAGRKFSQRQKVLRHMQTHTGDRPHKCDICSKRFSEPNTLAQHKRTHTNEKPYVCDFEGCGKGFAIAGSLTIHKRTHTGDRPFKCTHPGCERAFSESSNLTKHMRVHSGERPFKCPDCDRCFSRPDQMNRHRKVHNKKG